MDLDPSLWRAQPLTCPEPHLRLQMLYTKQGLLWGVEIKMQLASYFRNMTSKYKGHQVRTTVLQSEWKNQGCGVKMSVYAWKIIYKNQEKFDFPSHSLVLACGHSVTSPILPLVTFNTAVPFLSLTEDSKQKTILQALIELTANPQGPTAWLMTVQSSSTHLQTWTKKDPLP